MMMLTKLKAVSLVAAAGLMLLGGLGAGALPHAFAQGPAAPAAKAKPTLGPSLTDAEFLKRNCETLRGTPATSAELGYFIADADANKRKKVVLWLTEADVRVRWQGKGELNFSATDTAGPWRGELNLNGEIVQFESQPAMRYTLMQSPLILASSGDLQVNLGLENSDVRFSTSIPNDGVLSDADFLNKATTESRGSAPTRLEREYFLADKNPKKREKLLDLLLSDPAVAKKVGPEWKKSMLNPTATWVYLLSDGGHDWSKLIGELIAAKKTDDQVLEALALAITGRLASDGEKKLAGAMVAKQKDKPTAWAEVATALAGTDEAKKHAQKLKGKANVNFIEWYGTGKIEVVPAPVAPKK